MHDFFVNCSASDYLLKMRSGSAEIDTVCLRLKMECFSVESESAVDAHFDEKLITYRPRDGKLTLYLLVLANLFKEG